MKTAAWLMAVFACAGCDRGRGVTTTSSAPREEASAPRARTELPAPSSTGDAAPPAMDPKGGCGEPAPDVHLEVVIGSGFPPAPVTLFVDGNSAVTLRREAPAPGDAVGEFAACLSADAVRTLEGTFPKASAQGARPDMPTIHAKLRSGARAAEWTSPLPSTVGADFVRHVNDAVAATRASPRAALRLELVPGKTPGRAAIRFANPGTRTLTVLLDNDDPPFLERDTGVRIEAGFPHKGPMALAGGGHEDVEMRIPVRGHVRAAFDGMLRITGTAHDDSWQASLRSATVAF
ncbi:hypothetical protein LVJ94_21495 [Pendulispora rubella]|uniref:Uncharacterized protein n=1 Tax=Pendulispora rubella TaxID=2741070 RepID=A0ABZ2LLT8_9BACT